MVVGPDGLHRFGVVGLLARATSELVNGHSSQRAPDFAGTPDVQDAAGRRTGDGGRQNSNNVGPALPDVAQQADAAAAWHALVGDHDADFMIF